jgi:hypothetical protein
MSFKLLTIRVGVLVLCLGFSARAAQADDLDDLILRHNQEVEAKLQAEEAQQIETDYMMQLRQTRDNGAPGQQEQGIWGAR